MDQVGSVKLRKDHLTFGRGFVDRKIDKRRDHDRQDDREHDQVQRNQIPKLAEQELEKTLERRLCVFFGRILEVVALCAE